MKGGMRHLKGGYIVPSETSKHVVYPDFVQPLHVEVTDLQRLNLLKLINRDRPGDCDRSSIPK